MHHYVESSEGEGQNPEEKLVGCCVGKRRCAEGEESIKFEGAPLKGKGIIRCLNRA